MRYWIVSLYILLGCMQLFGHEHCKKVYVGFRVADGTLDVGYGDNAGHLSDIISFLKQLENNDTMALTGVSFMGAASPEGTAAMNRRLATDRRNALERYVRSKVNISDSIVIRQEGDIAWELLAELVEHSDMPHKEDALYVLREVPVYTYNRNGRLIDSRKKQLMELQRGRTWHYMAEHFFQPLRNACAVLVTVERKPERNEPETEAETTESEELTVPVDTVAAVVDDAISAPDTIDATESTIMMPPNPQPFYMALKTNMLYDALAVPNVGAEFYLGKSWSIAADWMYGWWNTNRHHRYWRIYGGDILVRKWFGRKADVKPLTGHHIGVYGQLFTYDFEWGGKGYMGGRPGGTLWDELNYAAGVEYGYSLPVANRLNIDFTIGVGYWGGKYYEYIPLDGHYVWQATKSRHWFGPTKAEVSLVWLLGRGNHNRKGGAK